MQLLRLSNVAARLGLLGVIFSSFGWAVDVRAFGAAGNGTHDDTLAIQNAVNACGPGGTVKFSPGNYLVSGVTLAGDCTYQGIGNSTITLSAPNGFIFDISQQTGIRITNLVLDGNGIGGGVIAQLYAPVQNVVIEKCEFRNVPASAVFPANLAIVSTWGIANASIKANVFDNVAGGIWFTSVENVNITANSFVNVTQGDAIYVAPNPTSFPNGNNLQITGNTGANLARMGIELFQPDPSNGALLNAPLVASNSFSNWTGVGGMGMSIASGNGAIVKDNQISNVAGTLQDTGIEVVVSGAQIGNNSVTGGFAEGIEVEGTPNNVIKANRIVDVADSGIMLACDNSHGRCTSTNSQITGNVIVNAQNTGINLGNDWSNSVISNNTINRTAGYWPQDSTLCFAGIHQSPAPGPGVIESNSVTQEAKTVPSGFWFGGVWLNSSMPGSTVAKNVFRSLTAVPLGTGILDNTGNAAVGWIISGNTDINTFQAMN